MIQKVWKDPVWSAIIAAGILALIGAISTYFFDLWPSIKNAVISSYNYLGNKTALWNWLLGSMAICTAIVVFVLAAIIWQLLFPSKSGNNWRDYTKDEFFGLEWRWQYTSDGSIFNLYSCCARCSYQVFPEDVSSYRAAPKLGVRCDSCSATVGPFDETKHSLESKVERFIQQKLRTGSWASNKNE